MCTFAYSLFLLSPSSSPINNVGITNPMATPIGFATVPIVVAMTLCNN